MKEKSKKYKLLHLINKGKIDKKVCYTLVMNKPITRKLVQQAENDTCEV